jgi:hypothetical protein
MTSPFVTQLRARPGVIRLGAEGAPTWTVRVEMPDVWDTVRIEAPPTTPVITLKRRALEALYPEDFVLKLNGFEVLDENASIADAGAVNGSIFLLTFRHRRPVR